MFGANRILKYIFLASLVLGIFVIYTCYIGYTWHICHIYLLYWLTKKNCCLRQIVNCRKHWLTGCQIFKENLNIRYMHCLLPNSRGRGVKSIFTTHFSLSCLLFIRVWLKKTFPLFVYLDKCNHPIPAITPPYN